MKTFFTFNFKVKTIILFKYVGYLFFLHYFYAVKHNVI